MTVKFNFQPQILPVGYWGHSYGDWLPIKGMIEAAEWKFTRSILGRHFR